MEPVDVHCNSGLLARMQILWASPQFDILCVQALLQEQHIVTCHVRPQPGSKEAAIAMTLAVSTTTIEPGWTLTGDARPEPSLNCYVLDFGEQPATCL